MSTIDISNLPEATQDRLREAIAAGTLPDILAQHCEREENGRIETQNRFNDFIREGLAGEPAPLTPELKAQIWAAAREHAQAHTR